MESPAPFQEQTYKPPSPKQQSWGTVVSILIIVAMIVIGAYYAWNKRLAEQHAYTTTQGQSS